jgi:Carboxypeptidase regulatory-like domain/TonB dependent receptor-like, beta-barrel
MSVFRKLGSRVLFETERTLRSATCRSVAVLLCALLAITTLAAAQSVSTFDTGTIIGTITDPTGAVIPQATVTITNTDTSQQTKAVTGARGSFVAPGLPFGNYVVSAVASNFHQTSTNQFVLNVGATVNIHLSLSIAAATQKVQVTGTSASINTTSATSGTTLNQTQIRNLPTNGRDVTDFLEIAPGSVNSVGTFQGSVNGQENFLTGLDVTLDGQNASRGDVNGFSETEGNEQARLTRASVDSIQEINFANSGYSAEVGHSLGPQMNIVTKGGTNQLHGELFDFFRNDALDAKDYFTNSLTSPKVPLRMNQFGGNLGGPLVNNKLFFFANYEGIRQTTTAINSLYEIPSAYVRSQFVASMQPVLDQMAPLPAGCTAIPAPESCAVPGTEDPAGPSAGADLVYDPAALPTTLREDSGAIRVDYNLSNSDRMFVRYSIDDSLTNQKIGLNEGQTTPLYLRTQYLMIDETHVFSPSFINEASVAVNRFYSDTNSDTPLPLTGFSGFFTNLGSLPGPNNFNQINPYTVFEVLDNATKTIGSHTIKFGVQIRANRLDEWLRPQQSYEFGSFSDLENNRPFVLEKIGFPNFVGVRNSNWDLYAEDDWQVTPRLTLNLGLRTGINSTWSERNNQEQNFDFVTQMLLPATQPAYSGPTVDVAPRLGLAFDPTGRGQTVIHAYYGLFYNPMHFGYGLVGNLPAYQSYSVNVFQEPIVYPEPSPTLPPGTQNVSIFPQHPHDPYSPNWLFGIQQQVGRNTVFTINYTGNQDHRMQSGVDFAAVNLNPANYVTQARSLTGFASENYDADELQSSYNALQVQLRHNSGKLNTEINYSWSHEMDDMVNVFGGFSDPLDPSKDIGPGDWDIRHNFTVSAVYSLPALQGSNSFVRGALGGWQASSILQARTGGPVNVSIESGFFGLPARPDYTGQPIRLQNFTWPDHSYNVNAYQIEPTFNGTPGDPSTIGNVGRNSLRAPNFVQWDFSGMKNFPITEGSKLQFRADLFNVLNHPNFGNPDGGICTAFSAATPTSPASCTPNPNFGRIGQTIADLNNSQVGTGTARQVQFSLKFIF